MDSITRAKNAKNLLEKSYLKSINDTMDMEEDENPDALEDLNKTKQNTKPKEDTVPLKKENLKNNNLNALLPDKQRKQNKNQFSL
jgi:hypothetical protein